ncbi:unnamed protein product, partial [marine sediment metagenome]
GDYASAGNNSRAVLSLELFNPTYWKQDPLTVAKTGLAKMKTAVNKALGASPVRSKMPTPLETPLGTSYGADGKRL